MLPGEPNRMKQYVDRPPFLRAAIASVLIGAGVLSGCASATIDDAVPTAASSGLAGGPKDTGTFPNLNVKPQVATQQFTPQEQAAQTQALQSAEAAQAAQSTATTTDPAVLRKLAQTHAEDALKKIEAQQ